jgi:hypothetical protein
MCNNNTDCKCISDILKVINILQKKAVHHDEECDNTCDRRILGRPVCFFECNTRPIQLFLCGMNGDDPLVMPTSKDPGSRSRSKSKHFSSVFRVEKVDDCCCTLRVLKQVHEHEHEETDLSDEDDDDFPEFEATDSFFTLDLKCVCSIRCLDDTFVDCL